MRSAFVCGLTLAVLAAILGTSRRETLTQPATKSDGSIPAAFGAVQPRLSRDGNSIAFSYQGSIWRVPAAGGQMKRLTAVGDIGFDTEPVWSPDASRIAYVDAPNFASGALRIIDSQSGKRTRLPQPMTVNGTFPCYKLEWHPDGGRLLGVFHDGKQNRGLAWYDLNSGKVTTIVTPPRRGRFALSNSGDSIIYGSSQDVVGQQGGNDGPQFDLWRISSAGGEPESIGRIPARIHDLCFAADDGSLFIVMDLGGAFYDVWNVPIVEGDLMARARQVTFGQADEHRPSVSSDSRSLLYTENSRGATSLVVRDLVSNDDRTVTVSGLDFGTASGTLKLTTAEADSKEVVTARVSIESEFGTWHAPPGALFRVLKDYGHFYCEGETEFALPVGKYQMRVLRGPEYRTAYHDFEVSANKSVEISAQLERWTNPSAQGWHSGENHIHANYGYGEWYNSPETMLAQSSGEDIGVSNFMVANSDTDGIFDRRYFQGRPDPRSTNDTILYWNQEFRSTIWGHMTLVNLSQLVEPIMTGFKDTTNPWDIPTNSDIAQRTHIQNGLVNYTHVAQRPDDPYLNPYTGKSIPIDVALGNVDSLDLNASYAGTVPLWYRLLNCGFRLTASAGTDCFLNRIRSRLPGGDRVYVKLDGPLTYEKWIEGLLAGRSFVTNGPMLRLSVDGKEIGDTLRLAGAGSVRVKAEATAQFPIDKLELIVNGKVVATSAANGEKLDAAFDEKIEITSGGWLAIRATGPGHRDHPLGAQYAHTSPIYITVGGRTARSADEAAYFLKWIDRLHLAVRIRDRIPNDELKAHVEAQLNAARDVYRGIIAGK